MYRYYQDVMKITDYLLSYIYISVSLIINILNVLKMIIRIML
jgi:hypothetical protein